MVSRAAASRALTLAGVAALHAGAILALLAMHRSPIGAPHAEPPLVVLLLEPRHPPPAPAAVPRRVRVRALPLSPEPITVAPPPPLPAANPRGAGIDWTAEAAGAAARIAGSPAEPPRRAMGAMPTPDAAFVARSSGPGFHWDPDRKWHPLPGGVTLIPLGKRCGLALWLFIPMAAGCSLDKGPPARGDLFQHMDDPASPQQ